ncbi:MAG: YbbR-like domain-containing protein [Tannerellaceae bacterium]|nr:YbbR-like domain-containing protein [Tannerellaceae bacterium]
MRNTSGESGTLHVRKQDVETEIAKQLINTTNILSFEPQQIDVEYSLRAHKSVPVIFNGSIQPQSGYALSGKIEISPSTVEVYSSKERIDTLSLVNTNYTEIKNANKTISRIVQLEAIKGTSYEPQMVTITIPIEEFTEKTFEIPVQFIGVPRNYNIRAFPSMIKVNAQVPLSRYKDLSEDEFAIELNYIDLENNPSGSTSITLTQKPTWIENTTLSPNRIEFIFERIRPI